MTGIERTSGDTMHRTRGTAWWVGCLLVVAVLLWMPTQRSQTAALWFWPALFCGLWLCRGWSRFRSPSWFDGPFWTDWLFWATATVVTATVGALGALGHLSLLQWVGAVANIAGWSWWLAKLPGSLRAFVRGLREPAGPVADAAPASLAQPTSR